MPGWNVLVRAWKKKWRHRMGTLNFVEGGSRAKAGGENGIKREFVIFLRWEKILISWFVD